MSNDTTPVRQQYLEIKRQYPNAILFFRLGDFYETFDEDAEITARELDIVLTSRPIGNGLRAPLAGIPYHAVDNYLARLVEKGYHVAICEQIGDQPSKGIFPRQVTRVVTPGTIIEPNLLHEGSNNYLVSVVIENDQAGISYADITTGEFAVTVVNNSDKSSLSAELKRLHPAEIIHPDNLILENNLPGHVTPWNAWHFEQGKCSETLLSHFKTSNLDGFGLQGKIAGIRAAGALLQYIKENSSFTLQILTRLHTYNINEFMVLDASTQRNLELTETLSGGLNGSLLGLIDKTVNPMGKRLIRQWINKPLLDPEHINLRLDGISLFNDNAMLRAEVRSLFRKLIDIERLVNRIMTGHVQPRELVSLRETLSHLPPLRQLFSTHNIISHPALNLGDLSLCSDELNLLQLSISENPPATIQNSGIINSGYSDELDGIIDASKHAREWINNLENIERERTGIKSLKVGYNKIFGYYIEITHSKSINVPVEYIRKQTLVNAERYITPEMKEYETLVLNAEERIYEIETRLFKDICHQLSKTADRLIKTAGVIANLDVLSSLAETASLGNYSRPIILTDKSLEIISGRHPVVENLASERFTPNDIIFEPGEIIRVITGPNMSGKSTYLRQTALITLLAQMGSFVPASSAKIGIVDRIFTRIGAQDEIHAGQSTFMVEMIETANILHNATERSLLILDELGRGTSTYDGVSIAWSVIEFIHNHPKLRAKTLFATHYHELTQLADLLPGVRNYNVAVAESDGSVLFLHKIISGGADRSYGIHVAQLAGLPAPVIQRATQIMQELEKSSGRAINSNPLVAQQAALFPESNPLLDEINNLDINSLSPIEALNKLFEWRNKYIN
ncbi:MAG: DNA mismatch repair protein MutS [Chloroflexi bacterium GWB2_49_20]|nr:MAG: DNA mismatch repair protein MutS [Chloroflexi bacterium GWB2_49_20]OGN78909.1 MAG: DNA mismatch repair protein MutS [Chloroflexi bacterium GWC2_49_37]OGN86330.1 MAG: DNA mismatch repair protein MutS [Chloroflexi bacterium GWD2_49_16]HBG74559.1 DNA mismatch repair protein MutS [Anaerolineae bacterium]